MINFFFDLTDLHIGRGEETPQFEAVVSIKGRNVAVVKNYGRGGPNVYHWTQPFTQKIAEEKLFPIATRIARKLPGCEGLFSTERLSSALDYLIFEYVGAEELKRLRKDLGSGAQGQCQECSGGNAGKPRLQASCGCAVSSGSHAPHFRLEKALTRN